MQNNNSPESQELNLQESQESIEEFIELSKKVRAKIKSLYDEEKISQSVYRILDLEIPEVTADQVTLAENASAQDSAQDKLKLSLKAKNNLQKISSALDMNPEITALILAMHANTSDNHLFFHVDARTNELVDSIIEFIKISTPEAREAMLKAFRLLAAINADAHPETRTLYGNLGMLDVPVLQAYIKNKSLDDLNCYYELIQKYYELNAFIENGCLAQIEIASLSKVFRFITQPEVCDALALHYLKQQVPEKEAKDVAMELITPRYEVAQGSVLLSLLNGFTQDVFRNAISMSNALHLITKSIDIAKRIAVISNQTNQIDPAHIPALSLLGPIDNLKFFTDEEYIDNLIQQLKTYRAQHQEASSITQDSLDILNKLKSTFDNNNNYLQPASQILCRIIYPYNSSTPSNNAHTSTPFSRGDIVANLISSKKEDTKFQLGHNNYGKTIIFIPKTSFTIIYRNDSEVPETLRREISESYHVTFIRIDELNQDTEIKNNALILTPPQNQDEYDKLEKIKNSASNLIQCYKFSQLVDSGIKFTNSPKTENPKNIQTQIDLKFGKTPLTKGIDPEFIAYLKLLRSEKNPKKLANLRRSFSDFLATNPPFIYGLNNFNRECMLNLASSINNNCNKATRDWLLNELETGELKNKLPNQAVITLKIAINNAAKFYNRVKNFNGYRKYVNIYLTKHQDNKRFILNLVNYLIYSINKIDNPELHKNISSQVKARLKKGKRIQISKQILKEFSASREQCEIARDCQLKADMIYELKNMKVYSTNPFMHLLQLLHIMPAKPLIEPEEFNKNFEKLDKNIAQPRAQANASSATTLTMH